MAPDPCRDGLCPDGAIGDTMQYLHHPSAGAEHLQLTGDAHRYLFKVRRHRVGEQVHLRSGDDILYTYTIDTFDKKTAHLTLTDQTSLPIHATHTLHIGWCQIDPKSIEKVLPILNEMGVAQLTFFPCARSQYNFRLDHARMQKILQNSSQQCGRTRPMILAEAESLDAFLIAHPEAKLLHFSEDQTLSCIQENTTVILGPEGGFTDVEIARFTPEQIVGLGTPMILRSESAAVAVAARVLL